MIEEIKLNGLDNKPIKTTKKNHRLEVSMRISHRVILHQFLLVVKAREKLIH